MKNMIVRFSLALVALTLCTQSLLPVTQAQQIKGVPPFNFDKAAYEKRLRQAFDNQVMGYATVLIKHGQVVSEVSGGLARNSADGNVKMTTTIPALIGSTIKFTGGVTLLHLFESKNKAINPKGLSMDQWLDTQIYTYFPTVWQNGMDASIKKITFRHLLQHKSGFRNLPQEDFGDDGVKRMFDYLVKGVTEETFEKRVYANANVSLITYLIPVIANSALLGKVNQAVADKKLKADSLELHKLIADEWEEYMHNNIYSQITPAVAPSCNPTVEFANKKKAWAYDYTSVNDTDKGATRDSRKTQGYCQAQGGWYITARELAAFVANFEATNTLVSTQTRDLMFDDDKAGEMLVWSFTISDTVIQQKFNLSRLPYMGGDQGGAHATILKLPNSYYAVGIINSSDFGSSGVTRRLLRAFKTGIGVPEDAKCPQLAKDIKAAEAAPPTAEMVSLQSEIKSLQNDLKEAGPSEKPFIAKQIKAAQAKLDKLKAAQAAKLKALKDEAESRVCIL